MLVTPEYGFRAPGVHVQHRPDFDEPETNATVRSRARRPNGTIGHNAPRHATLHSPTRVTPCRPETFPGGGQVRRVSEEEHIHDCVTSCPHDLDAYGSGDRRQRRARHRHDQCLPGRRLAGGGTGATRYGRAAAGRSGRRGGGSDRRGGRAGRGRDRRRRPGGAPAGGGQPGRRVRGRRPDRGHPGRRLRGDARDQPATHLPDHGGGAAVPDRSSASRRGPRCPPSPAPPVT
jgi:hypothetical protein